MSEEPYMIRDNRGSRWRVVWFDPTTGYLKSRFFRDSYPKRKNSVSLAGRRALLFIKSLKMRYFMNSALDPKPDFPELPPPPPSMEQILEYYALGLVENYMRKPTAHTKTGVRGLTRDEKNKRWVTRWTEKITGQKVTRFIPDDGFKESARDIAAYFITDVRNMNK